MGWPAREDVYVVVRFGSYNLLDYGRTPTDHEREARVRAVIEGLEVDVLAVQELYGATPNLAFEALVELAEAVGLTSYIERPWASEDDGSSGEVALGWGRHDLHVALMWNPATVRPIRGFRDYGKAGDLWHSLIKGTLAVREDDGNEHEFQFASYHAPPFGLHGGAQAREFERVISAVTRPRPAPPSLIGADWNIVSADRTTVGGYYDPDPYQDSPWHDDLVYQCLWDYDDTGQRTNWRADRTPGDVLYAGGLADTAAVLDAPWQPTTGHWHNDPYGQRRIDAIRVTRQLTPALQAIETIRTDQSLAASDHLPVITTYAPGRPG